MIENNTTISPKLLWNDQTESILVKWADNAICYKWLHDKSFRKFKFLNFVFTIPVIILSTLTGTLNVGISSILPTEYIQNAQIIIGCINICAGIITTLLNFFRYAQLSESHFHAEIGWSKLQRNISIELSLDRSARIKADTFIKICRNDYERLIEQSPVIPIEIIIKFKSKYSNIPKLNIPDICDKLIHTKVYKNNNNQDNILNKSFELVQLNSDIILNINNQQEQTI
jgi:hypothetical protein